MNSEDKELLIRDLCARLPYGVKALVVDEAGYEHILPVDGYLFGTIRVNGSEYEADEVKLCLRPFDDATDEEVEEFWKIAGKADNPLEWGEIVSWLDSHFFDHRVDENDNGLIEKGLAIDITKT